MRLLSLLITPLLISVAHGMAFSGTIVGTNVKFPNLDDFYHNVFSVVAGDR